MVGTRASLSISSPNENWIQEQISSGEFASRSEVVNDLIRKAREIERVRAALIAAEQSGISERDPLDLLADFKQKAQKYGKVQVK